MSLKKYYREILSISILFYASGAIYCSLECFWRGHTDLISFFMGGLAGLVIGKLNHIPKYNKLKVYQECFIGMILVLLIELAFGLIALHFGFRPWDYSKVYLNYKGVICVPYAIIWYLITPFAMWGEDTLRWKLFNEGNYYSILMNYKSLFTLK
jgi:uncharacterized membrane protein